MEIVEIVSCRIEVLLIYSMILSIKEKKVITDILTEKIKNAPTISLEELDTWDTEE